MKDSDLWFTLKSIPINSGIVKSISRGGGFNSYYNFYRASLIALKVNEIDVWMKLCGSKIYWLNQKN